MKKISCNVLNFKDKLTFFDKMKMGVYIDKLIKLVERKARVRRIMCRINYL